MNRSPNGHFVTFLRMSSRLVNRQICTGGKKEIYAIQLTVKKIFRFFFVFLPRLLVNRFSSRALHSIFHFYGRFFSSTLTAAELSKANAMFSF